MYVVCRTKAEGVARLRLLAVTPFGHVQLYGRDTLDCDCDESENTLGGSTSTDGRYAIGFPFVEEDEDWIRARFGDIATFHDTLPLDWVSV